MTTTRLIRFILYALFFILLIAGGWYFIKDRSAGGSVGSAASDDGAAGSTASVSAEKHERHCPSDDTPAGKIPVGKPVDDAAFFQTVRDRYNGRLRSSATGEASGEILKDGRVLIDFSGRLAEMAFYHMAKAPEDIQYIPALTTCNAQGIEAINTSWLNYFGRRGNSMYCGFYSSDLKKDPDTRFKCRFTIDPQGKLHGFLDRSEESSNAKPDSSEGWESDLRDFYWRSPPALRSPTELNANYDENIGYFFRIEAPLSNAVYDALSVGEQKAHYYWGQDVSATQKITPYVLCEKIESRATECKIKFEGFTGRALDYQQEK